MKKILVIDDDPDIVEPIQLLLEGEGYVVETATKGEHTYMIIDRFAPDIVLLDMLISGSDGRKICQHLKTDKKTMMIPVVMMSAHPGAKNDAKKCGADGFVEKPFELEELLSTIRKFF